MGESTLLNPDVPAQPVQRLRPLHLPFDVPLILAVISLLIFGLLMVYSASWKFSLINDKPATDVLVKQIMWVGVGIAVATIARFINYHHYQKLVVIMMAVILVMLVAVLIAGEIRNGARRTLLGGSVQPSEAAKLVTIIYLAVWLSSKRAILNDITFGLLPLMGILGVISGLVLGQPDLSAVITYVALGGLLFFLAGGATRQIVPVVVVSLIIGWLLVWYGPMNTGRVRLMDYFNGWQDPQKASYHILRSFEAIVTGGLFGKGFGQSNTKYTGMPFAWTDSIFAIIVEETGYLGAAVVIGLYLIILWRGLKIAQNAPDFLGMLLASGITIWIVMEAIINMGVMVNLLPFAGNALPMVSAGGSSMVTNLAALGILLGIARSSESNKPAESERRSFGAVVDMRRRDRRRGLSRPRRPTGY